MKIPKTRKAMRPKLNVRNTSAVITILLLAAVGVYMLAVSRAATAPLSVEAEQATVANPAVVVSDATASGAKAVKFGAGTVNPGGQKCADLKNLVFCDDFDGAAGAPPDSAKWHILGGSSWGGQCFKNLAENISMDGQGNLKQTLINKSTKQCVDSDGYDSNISSGGMDTDGKAYFKHGTFEIRAKLSCAKSVWGAIWLATGTGPAWPQSGEIDIYELFNNKQDTYKNTIHSGNPHYQVGNTYTISKPLCQDYHVYGLIWSQGTIQFTLDGNPTNKVTEAADAKGRPWPFDTYDQRLLIDLQYGGPGRPNAGAYDISELPSSMLIDYVRVYK